MRRSPRIASRSSCRVALVLENCTLNYDGKCTILNIQASNLKYLSIQGEFTSLNLRTPMLVSLHVFLTNLPDENQSSTANLNQVFGCVPNLGTLAVELFFIEFLAKGNVRKFPGTFENMKKLSLSFDIEDEKQAVFIFSLLQNTPNLEVLDIEMCLSEDRTGDPLPNFWNSMDTEDFCLKHLQIVNILDFEDMVNATSFVRLLLGSAPELREINIKDIGCFTDGGLDEQAAWCVQQLLLFRRASAKAQVFIKSLSGH